MGNTCVSEKANEDVLDSYVNPQPKIRVIN